MPSSDTRHLVAHDEDYHGWILEQIELLKARRWSDLDIDHLADALGALGPMTKREIASRLTILLQHLLKWQFLPDKRSNSWRATILEQRLRINDDLMESLSLKHYPSTILEKEYVPARLRAADETGLPLDSFPMCCPYTAAQALDDDFWPGEAQR